MLILVAIEDELKRRELPDHQIEYIGVGKVNAVFNTLKAIEKYSPKKIINFVSRSPLYFEKKIIEQCLELCKRLLKFITEKIKLCYINSCVERIVSSLYIL